MRMMTTIPLHTCQSDKTITMIAKPSRTNKSITACASIYEEKDMNDDSMKSWAIKQSSIYDEDSVGWCRVYANV
jgi:hypothetical protein